MKKHSRSQSGQVLIISMIFLLILMALSGVLVSSIFVYNQHGRLAYNQERALQLAEAGIDKAIYELSQSPSYIGEANTTLGGGEFTVTVTNTGSNKRLIESTGFVPNAATPKAKKKVSVELTTSTAGVSFVYGVQVGYGGLVMNNNASIIGSVYSDGNVYGAQNTQVTGDVWVAGGVAASPDQQQILQTGVQIVADTSSEIDVAQSFEPSATLPISRVSFYIRKVGNPSNATIRIVNDNFGSPGSVSLASGTLNASSVGTMFGWIDVSMTTNPVLAASQTYWIVMDMPSSSATRYYVWGKHDNSGYGNGVGKFTNDWSIVSPVWTDANGDMTFKTWMGAGNTLASSMIIGADVHANTVEDSTVAGNAYYQTISNTTVTGSSFPGSSDPPTLDLPITQSVIDDFETVASGGGTITPAGGTHIISGINTTLGPVKIAGDLLIDNGAIVTLNGPVWVEGDIILDNNSILQLDPSFGSDSCMMIADYPQDAYAKGKILVRNNAQVNGSGDPDSYLMLLSTFAHPTTYAIDVINNTDGAIFYSTAGIVNVNNNVLLREVIAYKLNLSNNASVTYESGLANVQFSSGPTGGWVLKRGSWRVSNP